MAVVLMQLKFPIHSKPGNIVLTMRGWIRWIILLQQQLVSGTSILCITEMQYQQYTNIVSARVILMLMDKEEQGCINKVALNPIFSHVCMQFIQNKNLNKFRLQFGAEPP